VAYAKGSSFLAIFQKMFRITLEYLSRTDSDTNYRFKMSFLAKKWGGGAELVQYLKIFN